MIASRDGALQRNGHIMNERYSLPEETIAMIAAVFARHPEVERVILYGSRANGNDRRGSDIDLALQGGDGLTERVLYSIVRELDELPVPYSFDVAIHSMIVNQALLDHIRRRGAVMYERRGGGVEGPRTLSIKRATSHFQIYIAIKTPFGCQRVK